MKIKLTLLVVLTALITAISCERDDNDPGPPEVIEVTYCWQIMDLAGNSMYRLCNRTEAQMKDTFPNPCNYYKLGDSNYCWLVDGSTYIPDVPEDYVKRFIQCYNKTSYTKVACGYCKDWYTRKKSVYKPTNAASYSAVKKERLCGDTVKTLYQGRQVIVKETSDSLIVVEFSTSGIF